jgi:hypothetical protein
MGKDPQDLEAIERLFYKHGADMAVAMGRSFERLEEHIANAELRLYNRISFLEHKLEAARVRGQIQ